MRLVFDIEANGLRGEADKIWCICMADLDTNNHWEYGPDELRTGLEFLFSADELVGHNVLDYDLPLIEDLYGIYPTCKVTDTLVLSRLLNNDRWLPRNCPKSIQLPSGKTKRITPHSLEAWCYRTGGELKVQQEQWKVWEPNILFRCESDVRVNKKVYFALSKEAMER